VKIVRTLEPVVSTKWLSENCIKVGLIIIDIRSNEEYLAGHIPGAVNVPFTAWITTRDGLQLELPDKEDLFRTIGSAGITPDSQVVVVHKTDNPFPLADACRVADTLIYSGVANAAVLNGGINKWTKEGNPLSCENVSSGFVTFLNSVNRPIFVDKQYVRTNIGKSLILDARDPASYYGITLENTAARRGHIPTAKCLPSPWIWTAEGTYKDTGELKQIAAGAVGEPGTREVIVYCGVGGYASAWWFVLTQLLGYQNVKFYDGSAQDWTRDPELPVVIYKWE
jgi:thiosulfate/3-mercaptopyruvate sulfurtransferase